MQGFDGLTAGTVFASGSGLGRLTFGAFDLDGAHLQVVDRSGETRSNDNALEGSSSRPPGSPVKSAAGHRGWAAGATRRQAR